jgi:hypothetical protein
MVFCLFSNQCSSLAAYAKVTLPPPPPHVIISRTVLWKVEIQLGIEGEMSGMTIEMAFFVVIIIFFWSRLRTPPRILSQKRNLCLFWHPQSEHPGYVTVNFTSCWCDIVGFIEVQNQINMLVSTELIAPFTGSLKLNIYISYNTFYLQGSTKDDTSDI